MMWALTVSLEKLYEQLQYQCAKGASVTNKADQTARALGSRGQRVQGVELPQTVKDHRELLDGEVHTLGTAPRTT